MTPYELRFEIFKQAIGLSQDEYHCKYAMVEEWNKTNSVKMDYPEFPTYVEIEELANKINNFVSETK
jgi:hypothetical protein